MGENGVIKLKHNNFLIDNDGSIYVDKRLNDLSNREVQIKDNFENKQLLDKIKIVQFDFNRYLKKEGNSFYSKTQESGESKLLSEQQENQVIKTKVLQGFLEISNVNGIDEMVKMIQVQRGYEASQKTIQSHNEILGKLVSAANV